MLGEKKGEYNKIYKFQSEGEKKKLSDSPSIYVTIFFL